MFYKNMFYPNLDKPPVYFWFLLIPLMVWDIVWRGIALWKSAGHKQKGWFIALLIVNSLGILPIIYLAFFQKKSKR